VILGTIGGFLCHDKLRKRQDKYFATRDQHLVGLVDDLLVAANAGHLSEEVKIAATDRQGEVCAELQGPFVKSGRHFRGKAAQPRRKRRQGSRQSNQVIRISTIAQIEVLRDDWRALKNRADAADHDEFNVRLRQPYDDLFE